MLDYSGKKICQDTAEVNDTFKLLPQQLNWWQLYGWNMNAEKYETKNLAIVCLTQGNFHIYVPHISYYLYHIQWEKLVPDK